MNNRSRGHNWEREVINDLSTHCEMIKYSPGKKDFELASSRFVSKRLDDAGVDIWIDPDHELSDLAIQCKSQQVRSLSSIDVTAIPVIKNKKPILLVKAMAKRESRQQNLGKLAVMPYETFLELCKELLSMRKQMPLTKASSKPFVKE